MEHCRMRIEKSDVAHKEHNGIEELVHEVGIDTSSVLSFSDDRWRNGTWDLNLFVRDGKIDWDSVIVAEARRRKSLEMYPEPTTNQAPVIFRSSIIPWWAWLKRFHLPEAEQLNGRAAMVGFFMAYLVDGLSRLGMVDQTSNLLCKTCLFVVVAGIIWFPRTEDFQNLRNLVNEATFYDNQWKASWEDQNSNKKFSKQDQKTK